MDARIAVLVGFLLLPGCASRKQASVVPPPASFSGHTETSFGSNAEEIWQWQLAHPIGGNARGAVVRAVRRGNASFSIDNGDTWRSLRVGSIIRGNTFCRTDATSTMDLFLGANGSMIRLLGDTEIKIVRLTIWDNGIEKIVDTMIELRKGRIMGNVQQLAAASSYLVRTQRGLIQIPGTAFTADAAGSWVKVFGG